MISAVLQPHCDAAVLRPFGPVLFMRTFDTAEDQGHYDFLTGLITLDKFDGKDLPKLATALLAIPAPELSPEAIELRELRALIKHEITHFLDQTTTCWGIEFMIRKCRLLNAIEKGEDTSQAMEVFWLNASEMQMHHDLVKSHVPVALVSCDTITHRLLHDERHGAIILVSFFKQRRLVHDVPISMLSLLESNAIANEYLSRFDDLCEMTPAVRETAEATIERKLDKVLNDSSLSEYSVMILLARLHFHELSALQLLRFISALARFCLNAPMFSVAMIGQILCSSFKDEWIGAAISADLGKGMSRHVIMFKTIVHLYHKLCHLDAEKRQRYIDLLKSAPHVAIQNFWTEMGMRDLFSADDEMQLALKHLRQNNSGPCFQIANESFSRNTLWNEKQSLGGIDFTDIACIDILLADDSLVASPNRIDVDVIAYSYNVANAAGKIDKLTSSEIAKSHVRPELAIAMQLLASKMKRDDLKT